MASVAPLDPGVLVRAETADLASVRLIELASRRGWPNTYNEDCELIGTAHAPRSTEHAHQRLTQAGREAIAWLQANAVPDGWQLTESENLVVLNCPTSCIHTTPCR